MRRIRVRSGDVVIVNGMAIDADVLAMVINADARLLWAFLRGDGGRRIEAVPYNEEKVIWMEPADLSYAEEAAANNWSE